MDIFVIALLLGSAADPYEAERQRMVRDQIERRGVRHPAVLKALRDIPRHLFIPESLWRDAYGDHPLPIGRGQTISQPYIVASMSEMLGPDPNLRVLEIGTGSGYQAAILAKLFHEVLTIEIIPELARNAESVLRQLKLTNVAVRVGDGYRGWPEKAPFDRILLTAAPPEVPPALVEQLARGGRLVAPVGESAWDQQLVIVEKSRDGKVSQRASYGVRFVPMVKGEPR